MDKSSSSAMGPVSKVSGMTLMSKIPLAHGLADCLLPNIMTALPLVRVIDLQHRKKKKRGFAWFFLMSGLMKIQGAFAKPSTTANVAGWAYAMQAVVMAFEGFWHRSLGGTAHPEKVIGSNVCFCAAMWTWVQVTAFQHQKQKRSLALPSHTPSQDTNANDTGRRSEDANASATKRE